MVARFASLLARQPARLQACQLAGRLACSSADFLPGDLP